MEASYETLTVTMAMDNEKRRAGSTRKSIFGDRRIWMTPPMLSCQPQAAVV